MNIISEPNNIANVHAAYRPIIFDVQNTNEPPIVYCDVYFNGIYYKTLAKTTSEYMDVYRFDISDACQEFLTSKLPKINGKTIVAGTHYLECYCRFRGSVIDSEGFISQELPRPIQSTSLNEAVDGGGLQSGSFFVLNAVLQHENNQNLVEHLKSFHNYGNNTLVLSHRPEKYKLCLGDSDFISVFSASKVSRITIKIKKKNGDVATHILTNHWDIYAKIFDQTFDETFE